MSLTSNGLSIKRLDQNLEEIRSIARNVYGDNVNLEDSTPDAQIVGILAESMTNLWEVAEQAYQAINPLGSTGESLTELARLGGVDRELKKPTNTLLSITSYTDFNEETVDGPIYITDQNDENMYVIPGPVFFNVDGFAQNVYAESVELDTPVLPPDTLTKLVGPIPPPLQIFFTVTNPEETVLGNEDETDAELRARFLRETSTGAVGTIDAIREAVLAEEGTRECVILENDTGGVDSNLGGVSVPAFSIFILISNNGLTGLERSDWDNRVARAILDTKSIGVGTNNSAFPLNRVSRKVNGKFGGTSFIYFFRPTDRNVYVTVNLNKVGDVPDNADELIQQAFIDFANGDLVEGRSYGMGDTIYRNELFIPINTVPGLSVSSLTLGTSPSPAGTADLTFAITEDPKFLINNIVVNIT